MSLTTWAEIHQGDTIRALDGSLWHVEWVTPVAPQLRADGSWGPEPLVIGIHDGTTRTEVTYPATDPVERVERATTYTRVTGAGAPDNYMPTPEQHARFQAALEAKAAETKWGGRAEVSLTEAMEQPIDASVFTGNPELDTATDLITQADIDFEVIATETTQEQQQREAATKDEPLVLPVIESPLKLRSHLYLLHDMKQLPEPEDGQATAAALLHHHQHAHEHGPMVNPHLHRGDET